MGRRRQHLGASLGMSLILGLSPLQTWADKNQDDANSASEQGQAASAQQFGALMEAASSTDDAATKKLLRTMAIQQYLQAAQYKSSRDKQNSGNSAKDSKEDTSKSQDLTKQAQTPPPAFKTPDKPDEKLDMLLDQVAKATKVDSSSTDSSSQDDSSLPNMTTPKIDVPSPTVAKAATDKTADPKNAPDTKDSKPKDAPPQDPGKTPLSAIPNSEKGNPGGLSPAAGTTLPQLADPLGRSISSISPNANGINSAPVPLSSESSGNGKGVASGAGAGTEAVEGSVGGGGGGGGDALGADFFNQLLGQGAGASADSAGLGQGGPNEGELAQEANVKMMNIFEFARLEYEHITYKDHRIETKKPKAKN